jgi:hypothetical protein
MSLFSFHCSPANAAEQHFRGYKAEHCNQMYIASGCDPAIAITPGLSRGATPCHPWRDFIEPCKRNSAISPILPLIDSFTHSFIHTPSCKCSRAALPTISEPRHVCTGQAEHRDENENKSGSDLGKKWDNSSYLAGDINVKSLYFLRL